MTLILYAYRLHNGVWLPKITTKASIPYLRALAPFHLKLWFITQRCVLAIPGQRPLFLIYNEWLSFFIVTLKKCDEPMEKFKAKITLFHCINAFTERASLSNDDREVKLVKMPCSGMTTEVFMLKAFEAGADAVAILVCPEGACRYMEGNLRSKKRVEKTQKVLDEIGVGGQRLSLHNLAAKDSDSVSGLLDQMMMTIKELGKNPAAAA